MLFGISSVFAANGVPQLVSYQGRLLDASGNLLGGSSGTNYCFRFSIYNAVSSGTKLWPAFTPSTMTASVKNGIYNVNIGDTDAGGDVLSFNFEDEANTWLNIEVANSSGGSCASVSSFETLSPRQRLTASGYALNTNALRGVQFASTSLDLSGTNLVLQKSGNKVGIGTTQPSSTLHIIGETIATASSSASKALVIRGAASQSANLQEWQNSGGTAVTWVKPTGYLKMDSLTTPGRYLEFNDNNDRMRIDFGTWLDIGGAITVGNSNTLNGGWGLGTSNKTRFREGSAPVFNASGGLTSEEIYFGTSAGYSGDVSRYNGNSINFGPLGAGVGTTGNGGNFVVIPGPGDTSGNNGKMIVKMPSGTYVAGNLQEWQNDSGIPMAVISGAGNVGIGTTQPSSTLHVAGAITLNSNLGVGTSTVGTSGNFSISIASGTAPTTYPADIVQLWAQNIAGITELRVADSAGNVTTLSPHNYSLFHPEADYLLPRSYTSENPKKNLLINVDMYGAVRAIEALTGEQFIHVKKLDSGEIVDRSKEIESEVKDIRTALVDIVNGAATAGKTATPTTLASGIALADQASGQPFCAYVQNGVLQLKPGSCEGTPTAAAATTSPTPTPITESTPATEANNQTQTETTTATPAIETPAPPAEINPETTTNQTENAAASQSETEQTEKQTEIKEEAKKEEKTEKVEEKKTEKQNKEEKTKAADETSAVESAPTPSIGEITPPAEAPTVTSEKTDNPPESVSLLSYLRSQISGTINRLAALFTAKPKARQRAYVIEGNLMETLQPERTHYNAFDKLLNWLFEL